MFFNEVDFILIVLVCRSQATKYFCDLICSGKAPQEAADKALAKMAARVNGYGGVIVLSNSGEPVTSFTTERMSWAWIKDGVLHSGVNPDEDITEAVKSNCGNGCNENV